MLSLSTIRAAKLLEVPPSQSSSSWALHGRAQISTLRVREAFVKERYGQVGHERLLEHAGERLRQVLTVADPSDGWISFDLFIELCVLIDRLFGRGDHGLILQMGRYPRSTRRGSGSRCSNAGWTSTSS